MRVVFMGSPEFSVPVLDALVAAGHEVLVVAGEAPRHPLPASAGFARPRPRDRRARFGRSSSSSVARAFASPKSSLTHPMACPHLMKGIRMRPRTSALKTKPVETSSGGRARNQRR